jgi:hypothetical protein
VSRVPPAGCAACQCETAAASGRVVTDAPVLAEALAPFMRPPTGHRDVNCMCAWNASTNGMTYDVCRAPPCSNAWTGGAENHQPATEGDWNERRLRALQGGHHVSPANSQTWRLDAWQLQHTTLRIGSWMACAAALLQNTSAK